MDIDLTDHGREAAAAALRERGIETFEILERTEILDHPAGNEALLVRLPGMAPEILLVRVPRRDRRAASDPAGILKEAGEHYEHVQRRTSELLRRYANERDRAGIEAVLRKQADGSLTSEQAVEALGLRSRIDLLRLEREFRIRGRHGLVDIAEDLMHDIREKDARDAGERKAGKVPASDHHAIASMRGRGHDDAAIKETLRIDPSAVLPTQQEMDRETDRLVYGIEGDAPAPGLTVTIEVGSKMAKVRVRGTDGETMEKVAHPRWVGRNVGQYVDETMDRLQAGGALPEKIPAW